jgi:hypothetical protein
MLGRFVAKALVGKQQPFISIKTKILYTKK